MGRKKKKKSKNSTVKILTASGIGAAVASVGGSLLLERLPTSIRTNPLAGYGSALGVGVLLSLATRKLINKKMGQAMLSGAISAVAAGAGMQMAQEARILITGGGTKKLAEGKTVKVLPPNKRGRKELRTDLGRTREINP